MNGKSLCTCQAESLPRTRRHRRGLCVFPQSVGLRRLTRPRGIGDLSILTESPLLGGNSSRCANHVSKRGRGPR